MSPSRTTRPLRPALSQSAQRSAIIMIPAWQLPDWTAGMTLASATRRPSTPRTRSSGSTTARSSRPILQEPAWWWYESAVARRKARSSSSVFGSSAGMQLLADPRRERLGGEDLARDLDRLDHLLHVARLAEVVRVDARLRPSGRRSASRTQPRDSGRTTPGRMLIEFGCPWPTMMLNGTWTNAIWRSGAGLGRIRLQEQRAPPTGSACPCGTGCLRLADHAGQDVVVEVLADARQLDVRRRSRRPCSSCGSPMPDSSSRFGDSIAPPQTITSRVARASCGRRP